MPYCSSEKDVFNDFGGDCLKQWEEQQEFTEAERLGGVGGLDVLAEGHLGLVLQEGHGVTVPQGL